MSKFRGPNHVGESGTIAGVVHYKQFGQDLGRSVPAKYSDANTQAQQDQRLSRFRPALILTQQLKSFAKSFFQNQPANKTAFSKLMSMIILAFGGVFPIVNYGPRGIIVGTGDIVKGFLATLVKLSTSTITATWATAVVGPFDQANDKVYFLISNIDGTEIYFVNPTAVRSAGTCIIGVPGAWTGTEVYVSSPIFVSADGTMCSPFDLSDMLGPVDLA